MEQFPGKFIGWRGGKNQWLWVHGSEEDKRAKKRQCPVTIEQSVMQHRDIGFLGNDLLLNTLISQVIRTILFHDQKVSTTIRVRLLYDYCTIL